MYWWASNQGTKVDSGVATQMIAGLRLDIKTGAKETLKPTQFD